jgi:phosphatidylserine/phosphatidylglycerophosphate/cardiolipin synthase-like enzyme
MRTGWPLVVIAVILIGYAVKAADHPGPVARAVLPTTEPAAAAADHVVVEPDAGMTSLDRLMASAHRSLDMTMYELADSSVEAILAADAARGVRVRLILDGRLERSHNLSAFDYLHARGVQVVWASSRYFVTHEKAFVVDDTTAVVMSLNLASRYYATTRDVAVVDHDARDVAAVESVFAADLAGSATGTPAADDLAWSPLQAGADMVSLVDSARRSVAVESEELSDPTVIGALVAAAGRGVAVQVTMTYQSSWVAGFRRVLAAGGRVSVLHGETPVYIHAKILVVDAGTPQGRVLVGSQNISSASLHRDRELGIVLVDPRQVRQLAAVVASDTAAGTPFTL